MSKITVTLEFPSPEAASRFLATVPGGDKSTDTAQHDALLVKQAQSAAAPAPVPQPETVAAPAGKTPNDVNAAFVAYVKKGQGRTAITAKAILQKHGLNTFREASPEQCAALVAEYESA